MYRENVKNLEVTLYGRLINRSRHAFLRFKVQLTPFKGKLFFALQIHSFTEVVQKVQISNVDLDTHTEVCCKTLVRSGKARTFSI